MPRLCERPGCSAPADVAYGFDAASLVVWLDRLDVAEGSRAGALCRRHADAMVVPLGWMLDDRRDPVPRLFNRARMDDLTDGAPRPRPRRPRPDRTIELLRSAVQQLTLDELGRDELRTSGVVHEVAPGGSRRERVAGEDSTPAVPEPEPEPEPMVSPLGAVPVAVAPEGIDLSGPMAIVVALVGDEPPDDATDDAGADPDDAGAWSPRFDPRDDLAGLLKPRGRLLSRAFRGVVAEGG